MTGVQDITIFRSQCGYLNAEPENVGISLNFRKKMSVFFQFYRCYKHFMLNDDSGMSTIHFWMHNIHSLAITSLKTRRKCSNLGENGLKRGYLKQSPQLSR